MLPWLLPLGLLVTVVLVALFPTLPASLLAVVWGWILVPFGLTLIRARARTSGRDGAEGGPQEIDTPYWRTRLR